MALNLQQKRAALYWGADHLDLIVSQPADAHSLSATSIDLDLDDLDAQLQQQVKALGLRKTRTTYVLSPQEYQIKQVPRPSVTDFRLRRAIKLLIKEYSAQGYFNTAYDYFTAPAGDDEEEKIYLVMTDKLHLSSRFMQLEKTRLFIENITIPEMAWAQLLRQYDSEDPIILLYMRGESLSLLVLHHGAIELCRDLSMKETQFVAMCEQQDKILLSALVNDINSKIQYWSRQVKGQGLQFMVSWRTDIDTTFFCQQADFGVPMTTLTWEGGAIRNVDAVEKRVENALLLAGCVL